MVQGRYGFDDTLTITDNIGEGEGKGWTVAIDDGFVCYKGKLSTDHKGYSIQQVFNILQAIFNGDSLVIPRKEITNGCGDTEKTNLPDNCRVDR
jgi:hypothetical protein